MNDVYTLAKEISEKPYSIAVYEDETTSGGSIILVTHPELEGCMAQGKTLQEAIDELQSVTIEYIASLLEDGLPIPEPMVTSTQAAPDVYEDSYEPESIPDALFDLERTIQPAHRKYITTLVGITG
jgi:predicted RNase H-like HicB family nuclease